MVGILCNDAVLCNDATTRLESNPQHYVNVTYIAHAVKASVQNLATICLGMRTEGCSGAIVTTRQMTMVTTIIAVLKEQSPTLLGLNQ
jgi:hypothetical protein